MAKWLHSRKGVIEGEIVTQHDEWVEIRVTGDQIHRHGRGNEAVADGEIITVRKSFLREMVA
jgi:hypothetical protein